MSESEKVDGSRCYSTSRVLPSTWSRESCDYSPPYVVVVHRCMKNNVKKTLDLKMKARWQAMSHSM